MGNIHNEKKEKKENENFIIGYIEIKEKNKKYRIINSYENVKKEEPGKWNLDIIQAQKNEEEIKNCNIFINNKKINFDYYYKFEKEGKYQIKYIFKKLIKSTNFMFYKCDN